MKKLVLALLFVLPGLFATSQKVYFLYVQSEQEQPFFVKINERIHSSTPSGYCIISKLIDSTYSFTIGFPQQKYPDQKFSVVMRSRDHGYLLKNFGEKGWGLFNLQSMEIQMASNDISKAGTATMEKKEVTPFTDILAKASDNPSLREKPVAIVKVEEKKSEPIAKTEEPKSAPVEEKKTDPIIPANAEPALVKTNTESRTDNTTTPQTVAVVEKTVGKIGENISEQKNQEDPKKEKTEAKKTDTESPKINTGTEPSLVTTPEKKIDSNLNGKGSPVSDSVLSSGSNPSTNQEDKSKPSTPVETADQKKSTPEEHQRSVVTKTNQTQTSDGTVAVFVDQEANGDRDTISIVIPSPKPLVTEVKETTKQERKFLDFSTEKRDSIRAEASKEQTTESKPVTKPLAKNNCKTLADESDFLKLRKKMVAETDDDDMVDEARKYFKLKCFTTSQIKNLGVLFLDDLGKYKFFDMAYFFVSDIENFSTLQSELKNEYYINRFKSMLR